MSRVKRAITGLWHCCRHRRRHWATATWLIFAVAVWFFLGAPYAIDAAECLDERFKERRMQCLKPIAKKLRKDSIIATYATATVAAVIALQLANRNRVEATRRDDISG